MARRSPDDEAYRFLITQGAALDVTLGAESRGLPELQILGNRAGLLSLANILLWLYANKWRRELLSLAELPFIQLPGSVSLCVRVVGDRSGTGWHGLISRIDHGVQFEWVMSEEELQRVALLMHALASRPGHEYDRLAMAAESAAQVQIRMTDAQSWIRRGDV
jgi:hypothetical protein